jgi:formate hydrogenlyase subunit 3/multisubunit Na+/H+ antiporter MnhD subunit
MEVLLIFGVLSIVVSEVFWKYQRKFRLVFLYFVLTQATIIFLARSLYLDDSILDRIISVLMFLAILGIVILGYPEKKNLTEQGKQG